MTALAAIVNWNGEPILPSTLHRFAHSALLPPNTQLALSTHLAGPSVLSSGHVQLAADSPNPASILEAYLRHGVELWNHLDIQYSFVLWDAATEILLAARDPFGTRPLHYAHTPHGICLASQPKQFLLAGLVPLELDDEAALLFLAISIVPPRRTFFKNIHTIPPGHALLATRNATKVFRHWFTQPPPPQPTADPELFRELLDRSLLRTLPTDTPIQFELSGGLDSSSLLASAVTLRANGASIGPIHAYSHLYRQPESDERQWIESVLERYPVPHSGLQTWDLPTVTPAQHWDLNRRLAWSVDMPWASSFERFTHGQIEHATAVGANAVVSGIGGDDLLDDPTLADIFHDVGSRAFLSESADLSLYRRCRSLAALHLRSPSPCLPWPLHRVLAPDIQACFSPLGRACLVRLAEESASDSLPPFSASHLQQRLWRNCAWGPHLHTIHGVQRAALRSRGISLHTPLLDPALFAFVFAIPTLSRLPARPPRRLFRDAMSRRLPPAIQNRTGKADFAIPYAAEAARLISAFPGLNSFPLPHFLDSAVLSRQLRQYRQSDSPDWPDSWFLLRLLSLCQWYSSWAPSYRRLP